MSKYLVTFGTPEYVGSMQLLLDSAHGMIDGFACIQKDALPADFVKKHEKIFSQPRGFGYWLWKPLIILGIMNKIKDGDFCIYSDAANIITNDISPLFEKCARNGGILLFENKNGSWDGRTWKNNEYTKADCFNLMGCNSDEYVFGNQVDAAIQVYQKNEKTMRFLQEYLAFCEDERILTDAPNTTGSNKEGFRDHRHDQSVLSLLAIKYGVELDKCPTQHRNNGAGKNEAYEFPIMFLHHKRRLVFA
jgi:hypothetical protein